VLPPSYYASLFSPSSETIIEYFNTVADASPIPLIIYNFPGAVGGLDLSSDVIIQLAEHRNIVGVKLTCGNTGKLNRVVAATRRMSKKTKKQQQQQLRQDDSSDDEMVADGPVVRGQRQQQQQQPEFIVLAGSADFTVQSLAAGGHGILAGLANIAPKACIQTMELWREGKQAEALEMQEVVAQGDWTAIQGGVVGVKAGLQAWSGYGGFARRPLPRPTTEQTRKWKEGFRELVLLEKSL